MTSPSDSTKLELKEKLTRNPEKDKRFLIRQQLFFLLHALRCTKLAYTNGEGDCKSEHCIMMRNVVKHLTQCNDGKECKFSHCSSSREIIRHWKNCNDVECLVCSPLRRNGRKNQQNNDYTKRNQSKNWKTLLWKIREKIVDILSDEILPAKVGDDVRNHPHYMHVSNYVKQFEGEAFKKTETIHLYICSLSEHFERSFIRLYNFQASREKIPLMNNSPSRKRCQEFYFIVKDAILKSYTSIDGNPGDLFETIENIKEESNLKVKTELVNESTAGSSESSLKTISDNNNIKQEVASPPNSATEISPVKLFAATNDPVVDVKMSPDSTSDPLKCFTEAITIPAGKSDPETPTKPNITTNYKTWTKEEISELFEQVHQEIMDEKDSEPFRAPVDWRYLGIPDYPIIIKQPMDLSTIKTKMIEGLYHDPWQVVDDYWLMFNNAWTYNKKTSKVYKMCNTIAKIFENRVDAIMTSCGYCCGRYYVYLPQLMFCYTSSLCTIGRDAVYYAFLNDKSNGEKIVEDLSCIRYTCCEKCYNDNTDDIPFLANETNNLIVKVPKSLMVKCRNNVKETEEFINCRHCNRKWHRTCAIHNDEIWREGFVCKTCLNEPKYGLKMKPNTFRAKDLPHNNLSRHIENRINGFLRKVDPTINEVIIRVLSASDKTVEVKPGMKAHYCETGEMPETFNYRLKAIFAFQEIEGQEVCFFGFHAQEYGSDCPDPNARRVYIAYLDSVHYFKPREYRTDVYHAFIVGYLEYVKKLGFSMAHIWACPPGEGDDYIFHMHPPEQKLPKPKRLQEWYITMLEKAQRDNIVVSFQDILKDAMNANMVSPTELPYFEGDYWPNALEEIFKEIVEETSKRAKSQSESNQNSELDSSSTSGTHKEIISKNNLSKMDKKPKKRKLKRMNSTSAKRKKLDGANNVLKKVMELMEKRKENFFVIRLYSPVDAAALPSICDPDPLIASDLMDGREKFLTLARDRHLEFSSLRRAKYSTLIFAYELHMEHRLYTCNSCNHHIIDVRYTCRECDDFELCESCYLRFPHTHKLVRVYTDDVDQFLMSGMPSNNNSIKTTKPHSVSLSTPVALTNSSMATVSNPDNKISISKSAPSLNNNAPNVTSATNSSTGLIKISQETSILPPTNSNNPLNASVSTLSKVPNQNTNNSSTNNNTQPLDPSINTNTTNVGANNITDNPQDLQDTTRAKMVRYSQSLQHACQCRDVNCRINFCLKMKSMVKHLQFCNQPRQSCKLCCTFLRICMVHAKFCNEQKCPVPQCLNYRNSWKQQGSQQRMQQAQLLRRRMVLMQRNSTNDSSNSTGSVSSIQPVNNSSVPNNNANSSNNSSNDNNDFTNSNPKNTTSSSSSISNSNSSNGVINNGINNNMASSTPAVTPQEEQVRSSSFGGKVPNVPNDEIHKQQQQQQQQFIQHRMNYGMNKPIPPHHQLTSQKPLHPNTYHMNNTPLLTHMPQQVMIDQHHPQQSQYMYHQAQSHHSAHHQHHMMAPNNNMMSLPNNQLSFTEDDVKIVNENYRIISKNSKSQDEFRKQLGEFLNSSNRYKAAFDYLSRKQRAMAQQAQMSMVTGPPPSMMPGNSSSMMPLPNAMENNQMHHSMHHPMTYHHRPVPQSMVYQQNQPQAQQQMMPPHPTNWIPNNSQYPQTMRPPFHHHQMRPNSAGNAYLLPSQQQQQQQQRFPIAQQQQMYRTPAPPQYPNNQMNQQQAINQPPPQVFLTPPPHQMTSQQNHPVTPASTPDALSNQIPHNPSPTAQSPSQNNNTSITSINSMTTPVTNTPNLTNQSPTLS